MTKFVKKMVRMLNVVVTKVTDSKKTTRVVKRVSSHYVMFIINEG